MLAALTALTAMLLVAPAATAATGTCSVSGGGPAAGNPGVVLGPATKCVRGSTSDPVINVEPAGATQSAQPQGGSAPWMPVAGAAALVLAGVMLARRSIVRRAHRVTA